MLHLHQAKRNFSLRPNDNVIFEEANAIAYFSETNTGVCVRLFFGRHRNGSGSFFADDKQTAIRILEKRFIPNRMRSIAARKNRFKKQIVDSEFYTLSQRDI